MDQYKERNLQSLVTEFHDKGKANKGLRIIHQYLKAGDLKGLSHLLRDHEEESVYEGELKQRFEVDELISFYNLLLVAVFAGYIPPHFSDQLNNEIKMVLGSKGVMPYYKKHYPYKMASFTYQYVNTKQWYAGNTTEFSAGIFNEFAALNRAIKQDDDIDTLIGMLDYVSVGDEDIEDLMEALSSQQRLSKIFTTKSKSYVAKGVRGFIKYMGFLSSIKELLLQAAAQPLLQSAIWYFHGYYFDRFNREMKSLFQKAFTNIEKTLQDPAIFSVISGELFGAGEDMPGDIDHKSLKEYAAIAIAESRADMLFVLDKKWAEPLKQYFKKA